MIISLEDAASHLNIELAVYQDSERALITSKIEVAEAFVATLVTCEMTPEEAPAPVKEAVRQLVGTLYENRETAVLGANLAAVSMPFGFWELIGPYRRWVF